MEGVANGEDAAADLTGAGEDEAQGGSAGGCKCLYPEPMGGFKS